MKRFLEISQMCLILGGLLICGLFVTTLVGMLPIGEPGSMARQWTIFAGQNILAFIIPAMVGWRLCIKSSPVAGMGISKAPSMRMLLLAVVIFAVGLPALNQIVWYNSEMHLPEAFGGFEQWCRDMEDLAQAQTDQILATDSLWRTCVNILIIGVLTGIGEEFFFRGAFQRMLIRFNVNPHAAIWTGALVFSAMHFQFFGFIPRVILGAWFGYLYWWSGSIWVNAFAHALNNSLVIISAWCIRSGWLSEDFDMLGVATDSFPWAALASALLTAAILYLWNRHNPLKPAICLPSLPKT